MKKEIKRKDFSLKMPGTQIRSIGLHLSRALLLRVAYSEASDPHLSILSTVYIGVLEYVVAIWQFAKLCLSG